VPEPNVTKIIAELCQNHKGDRSVLKDMIWEAARAGADYAKIQSIRADELTSRERFEEGCVEGGVVKTIARPYKAEYVRLKPMDLDEETHLWFIEECGRAGIKPLTTVFTRAVVRMAARLPWREVKVASYDCGSYPMLRELRANFEHLYVSTGATYDEEIEEAARILDGHRFTFLHCITIYPTPLGELNLARMNYLRRFTPTVGFSDHSLVARDGIKASIVAISLGADVIERHFSVLPPEATKDGPVSISPRLLRDLVAFARMPVEEVQAHIEKDIPEASQMMGRERRALSHAELLNRDYYRGRFASRLGGSWVYNWEDRPLA